MFFFCLEKTTAARERRKKTFFRDIPMTLRRKGATLNILKSDASGLKVTLCFL
jgi:hypothetical protein